jgi:Sulfotransferase family
LKPETVKLSRHAQERDRPVIVGGCPRSGTTLLRTMLNSHPELGVPRETRFVLEIWEKRHHFGDLRDPEKRRGVGRWIFRREETNAGRLGLNKTQAIRRLMDAPPTLGSLLATAFLLYAERFGKIRWGDKRPTYAARMYVIWDFFPTAQFINMVRDPRACAASMRKLGWYDGDIAPAVELWERSVKVVDRWRKRLAPDQLVDIKYEDLVADPAAQLPHVAAFTGLAGDDHALESMLHYYEDDEARNPRYHANVSRPPDPSRVDEWKKVLEPGEVAFIEQALGPLMTRYGYEASVEGTQAPRELFSRLASRRRTIAWSYRKTSALARAGKIIELRRPVGLRPLPPGPSAAAPAPARNL